MNTETIECGGCAPPVHTVSPIRPPVANADLYDDINRVIRGAYDAGFKKGEAVGEARSRADGPHRSDRWLGVGLVFGFAAGVTVTALVVGYFLPAGAL